MKQKKHSWRKTTGLADALHGMQRAERLQTNDSAREPKMADQEEVQLGCRNILTLFGDGIRPSISADYLHSGEYWT